MTREDAIYWIKNLAALSTEKDMPQIEEALNMAIEALADRKTDDRDRNVLTKSLSFENTPETKRCSKDMISRQAAVDALDAVCDRECEYSKQQRSVMCGACRLGSAFDAIDDLPSAEPERCEDCGNFNKIMLLILLCQFFVRRGD